MPSSPLPDEGLSDRRGGGDSPENLPMAEKGDGGSPGGGGGGGDRGHLPPPSPRGDRDRDHRGPSSN
eukprot:CAMPEP_0113565248 /NCGR_PEP_ID=MMETSP0015_2-20120614/22073_1 /TAXON_ID=2838 /ORGANISM="Odontella" /LENGTH=66 /DNA_ID=CAMNT_0000467427 /DNA_START=392 /DNA_END=589 /DNA_ORIENTATION=+ /assembly_acc=CAM_ASM_000160